MEVFIIPVIKSSVHRDKIFIFQFVCRFLFSLSPLYLLSSSDSFNIHFFFGLYFFILS